VFRRSITSGRRTAAALAAGAVLVGGATLVGGAASAAPAGVPPGTLSVTNEGCAVTIRLQLNQSDSDYVVEVWQTAEETMIAEFPIEYDGVAEYIVGFTATPDDEGLAPVLSFYLDGVESTYDEVEAYEVTGCVASTSTSTVEPTTSTTEEAVDPVATPTAPAAEGIAAEATYTG
jgi:hypothetical protein